ncbi:alpha/beta-hydrolase [Colletotrichum somersetense]|nr:alpha/beta-hydrolase [Colletotrichum somersetense]
MSRFAPFTCIDFPYRIIDGVPLEATIMIPSSIPIPATNPDKKYPVMVYWHGGGFVVGHRLYEPWFTQWLLDLALANEAIIITADYRLLPEANGSDVISDVAHLWRWLQRDLPRHVERDNLPRLDIGNILCCGESSGGFISVYCGLHLDAMLAPQPDSGDEDSDGDTQSGPVEGVKIRAVISIAAPLDDTDPVYKVPRPRVFMGTRPPPPRQALAKIRGYLKNITPGSIRTGSEPTADMWELFLCLAQQNYMPRLFGLRGGQDGRPAVEGFMETLGKGDKTMAPVWVVHGGDDTMVPSSCSSSFVRRLQGVQPEVPVHLSICPGEHLFYVNVDMDAGWVQEGALFLRDHWPKYR